MKYPFPKVDLHLHLDGSMPPALSWELAQQQNYPLPVDNYQDFLKYVVIAPENGSVNEFLQRFDMPTALLQTKEALYKTAYEETKMLAQQGLFYAEIRFAPQLHTQKGLTQEDAFLAVLKGTQDGMRDYPTIRIGLILCCMVVGQPQVNHQANLTTVELCGRYKDRGAVAMDLAGAEGLCPLTEFGDLFARGRQLGLNMTCHAGDSQGPDTVRAAIGFGVTRIGHGHHVFEDKELCQICAQKHIALEICLTSNIQCHTQPSFEAHPAKQLMDMEIPVTLNTDNMTISNVTLDSEYDIATSRCGFTYNDLIRCNIASIQASFMPKEEKQAYVDKLSFYLQ